MFRAMQRTYRADNADKIADLWARQVERQAVLAWLYVDMNSYFASVEQHDRPDWRGRPLIVTPVTSEYSCAIAASYAAKARGIKTGTRVKEARQMCPDLIVVEARPDRYVAVHHQVREAVERHIPVTDVCSIDEFACALTSHHQLPEMATLIGRRIQQEILVSVGPALTASVGIAATRMLAKLAADMHKPSGLTLLDPGAMPRPILHLPLSDFPGIGPAMAVRLARARVATVADLWGLSPARMRQLWRSINGERFWYDLHGRDLPPLETRPPQTISHGHVLAPELRPRLEARKVVRRLTIKCGSRLRRMGYRCRGLVLSMRIDGGPRDTLEARFASTQDTFALLRACDGLWAQWQAQRPGATHLKKVNVTCLGLEAAAPAEPDLFSAQATDAVEATSDVAARHLRLFAAMDALNQRFGKDVVTLGPRPKIHSFVGAKIAFGRIPARAEFSE